MRVRDVKTYCATMSVLREWGGQQQQREQRRAFDSQIDVEMLVMGVSAVADGTQPVKRRGVQTGRVAVGRSAGGGLGELKADLAPEALREPPQGTIARGRLERGPTDRAFDNERAAG